MTEEKANDLSSTITLAMEDRDSDNDEKIKLQPPPASKRRLWLDGCVILLMLFSVVGLAIGLGIGMNSNSTSTTTSDMKSKNTTTTSIKAENNISKSSWPELIGMDADNASAWMKEHHPEYDVFIVDQNEYVTTDYNLNRVRIYKAPNGTVYKAPQLGR